MVTTATPAPEMPAPGSTNSFARIIGALFSPKATFASIAARPTWAAPLIIFCVFGIAATYVIGNRIGWRAVIEKQIANSPSAQKRMEQLTPEQREQAINNQAKFSPAIVYTINVVAPFIGAVVVGGILLGAFNLILGGKVGFKTSLGIVAYAWTPGLIALILAVVILYIKDPATIDVQNIVASNPGALLSDDSPRWMVAALSSLDLFSFWTMILMSFGYSATDPKKISFGKAFGTVFGLWLIYVLVKVGFAAAFS
jgi:hypothetical protein